MPLRYLDESGFNAGMVRDQPSWQLPAGAVYDAQNFIFDQPGIARQRGGTTALVSGSQTAFNTSLGFCYSDDSTPIEELYGLNGKTGSLSLINKSTGAASTLSTPATAGVVGRPVRHFGFVVFPTSDSALSSVYAAGQTTSTTFTNTAAASITAGSPLFTLTGADVTTNIKVGGIVSALTGTPGTLYAGRVVSINTTKTFSVWPVPTLNMSFPAAGIITGPSSVTNGGKCATSFQNRLLFGNTFDMASRAAGITRADRRVNYSPLPTEASGPTSSLLQITPYGGLFIGTDYWPVLNWFEIPGADPIVAMEPISDGELLILTNTSVVIFQGNLVTELSTTNPSVTYEIYPLGVTEGCASDLSVQRTPIGIMWAGAEGVFAYWPPLRRSPAKTGIRNLCEGKILKYWLSLSGRSDFAVHGAAYTRDHYIVSGFANGATFSLMVNLASNQWTRLSGAGTDTFNGVRRPTNPAQTFASRWWDQAGAAPSMTNGQTVRLESIADQYTAGSTKTDSDGGAVAVSLTTRTITGDAETQKIFQRGTVRHQQSSTTAAVTVTAQSTIDTADTDASRTRTLGSLSNTSTLTLSNATNANPIACTTTANHGLQTDDFVDIDGVLGNTNANGRWRITVTGNTTFTLVGGIGNAAYTSGGKVKKLTETDYTMSALNAGQGASITVSGSPNNFELHGVRLAVLERPPVMSA